MNQAKVPKDYAERKRVVDSIRNQPHGFTSENWEYRNKESFAEIARYFLFFVVGAMVGYILSMGVQGA